MQVFSLLLFSSLCHPPLPPFFLLAEIEMVRDLLLPKGRNLFSLMVETQVEKGKRKEEAGMCGFFEDQYSSFIYFRGCGGVSDTIGGSVWWLGTSLRVIFSRVLQELQCSRHLVVGLMDLLLHRFFDCFLLMYGGHKHHG